MTAVLVSLAEFQRFLGNPSGADATLLQELLDHVEGLFLSQCGRRLRPFIASGTGRSEVKSGTGCDTLVLDYPITDITSIKIGPDSSDPDETLDVDDIEVIRWTAGERTVRRVDGGVFGTHGLPRIVHAVYDHQADKPEGAKIAIKRAGALIFRQLGSEDAAQESLAGYSRTMAKFGRDFVDDDPIWKMAVDALQEVRT